ncbi:glutamine synthetase family protein [Phenylobacterium aquaticum]|uniref:glutamine synthetase family protein n=1 Tax=Phenylobacterium aquaticum TaxID=1763816 RepID=UPI001F5C8B63|nr:glutamine synthetase family protein [Phenylobacterium aquaticum]MCI3131176.1 glutamine synthetase family protein [Phenylobacterium aquaticum]
MSAPQSVSLSTIVTTDFAAITRGRAIAADRLEAAAGSGVGWLPANLALTPFDSIASPNPWGSFGDLRLAPDLSARFRTTATGASSPFDLVVGDVVELDGAPWRGCPRGLLRTAADELAERHGLILRMSFEQEFQAVDVDLPPAHALSFGALRRVDPFGPTLFAALAEAGVEPEVVLPEFGRQQFEVTCAPAEPVRAADRAVAIREIVRELGRNCGLRASFAPKVAVDGVGNGVHIHLSLWDKAGRPVTRDAAAANGLSAAAGAFFSGVLRHMPALVAFTAPSPPSYLRLRPQSWSAAYTWLADRDREAALRVCPTWTAGGGDPDRQFNVEYRAADATANPYLAAWALVRAGLAGLDAGLAPPPIAPRHPDGLSAAERTALGVVRLPESLEDALAALDADPIVRGWLAGDVLETYVGVRRAELARVAGLSPAQVCDLYQGLY